WADYLSAGRPGAAWPGRERARPTDRWRGPDHCIDLSPDRADRPWRDHAPVGRYASTDGYHPDRLDDSDRPWPARANHRRPPDGQDGGGDRHDQQPKG